MDTPIKSAYDEVGEVTNYDQIRSQMGAGKGDCPPELMRGGGERSSAGGEPPIKLKT